MINPDPYSDRDSVQLIAAHTKETLHEIDKRHNFEQNGLLMLQKHELDKAINDMVETFEKATNREVTEIVITHVDNNIDVKLRHHPVIIFPNTGIMTRIEYALTCKLYDAHTHGKHQHVDKYMDMIMDATDRHFEQVNNHLSKLAGNVQEPITWEHVDACARHMVSYISTILTRWENEKQVQIDRISIHHPHKWMYTKFMELN